MDNQHRKIKGYRELTEHEVNLMNAVKDQAQELQATIDQLESYRTAQLDGDPRDELSVQQILESSRCLSIAKNELQTGMMWLVRAVALPDSF